ncbi:unnamed protein product [Victoria cruziana]
MYIAHVSDRFRAKGLPLNISCSSSAVSARQQPWIFHMLGVKFHFDCCRTFALECLPNLEVGSAFHLESYILELSCDNNHDSNKSAGPAGSRRVYVQ